MGGGGVVLGGVGICTSERVGGWDVARDARGVVFHMVSIVVSVLILWVWIYVWSQCEELPVGLMDIQIRIRRGPRGGLIQFKI